AKRRLRAAVRACPHAAIHTHARTDVAERSVELSVLALRGIALDGVDDTLHEIQRGLVRRATAFHLHLPLSVQRLDRRASIEARLHAGLELLEREAEERLRRAQGFPLASEIGDRARHFDGTRLHHISLRNSDWDRRAGSDSNSMSFGPRGRWCGRE